RTATAIAGLCWRLQDQEILEHPKVRSALRRLEEQLAEHPTHPEGKTGRHRTVGRTDSEQIGDASGDGFKPHPHTATTPAAFVELLRQYRAWSGDPPWRKMAERAGHAVVHSTMYNAVNGDVLPKLEVVKAIIVGCGGGEDDVTAYVNAWRRLAVSRPRSLAARAAVS